MRSILVAIYELGAEELFVVGHHGCGMAALDADRMLDAAMKRGITQDTLNTLKGAGIDLHAWLQPVQSIAESVRASMTKVRTHPLTPDFLNIEGLIMDPETGKLETI
jgi:carbonic anhydrase